MESDILQSAKPKESYSEFTKSQWTDEGHLRVVNDRYKTRLRQSKQVSSVDVVCGTRLMLSQTRVVMTNEDGREFFGRPGKAQGRATTIKFDGARVSGTIESVRVVGRQELTNAERACNEFLLLALQGRCNPLDSQFVRTLWFPTLDDIHSAGISENHLLVGFPDLNQSQRKVTAAMVSRSIPMVIVHGDQMFFLSAVLCLIICSRSSWHWEDDDDSSSCSVLESTNSTRYRMDRCSI